MRLIQSRFVIFTALVISIGMLVYFCCAPHKSVVKIIAKMPENDRLVLADFFEELVQNDSFGHTLFGNKPISFYHYLLHPPYVTSQITRDKRAFFVKRAKTLLEKYKDAFKLKDFVLKFTTAKDFSGNDIGVCYLINKKKFYFRRAR
jgi:hypothetical protein